MSIEDVDRAQFLSEQLEEVNAAIEEARVTLNESESTSQYESAIETRVVLLADRQHIVEQLEALGLEDPDL